MGGGPLLESLFYWRLTEMKRKISITGLCVLGGHSPTLLGWAGCTGCSLWVQGRGGALQAELGQAGPETVKTINVG